ncbi:hypothetical protein [Pseudanabaena minima]|uniref:hypothetical protein n=1 Tax=Pseudanabaena minima TaxID=890415 RepID=UPI003DA967A1
MAIVTYGDRLSQIILFTSILKMNTSTLNRLPQAIADQSYKILALDKKIREVRETVASFEIEIERTIAFSQDLKNDSQRKSLKSQMILENEALQDSLKHLQALTTEREESSIELTLLRDRFAIAKLEARERIAKTESLAA